MAAEELRLCMEMCRPRGEEDQRRISCEARTWDGTHRGQRAAVPRVIRGTAATRSGDAVRRRCRAHDAAEAIMRTGGDGRAPSTGAARRTARQRPSADPDERTAARWAVNAALPGDRPVDAGPPRDMPVHDVPPRDGPWTPDRRARCRCTSGRHYRPDRRTTDPYTTHCRATCRCTSDRYYGPDHRTTDPHTTDPCETRRRATAHRTTAALATTTARARRRNECGRPASRNAG